MTEYTSIEKIIMFLLSYVFAPTFIITASPFGFLWDFCTIHNPNLFKTKNSPEKHRKKVDSVQKQVKQWNQKGRKNRMCTARPGWKSLSIRKLVKSNMTQINVDLDDIIEIDTSSKVLRVEPGMMMGTLTHQLLDKGWTIPVIPEFESLTVGGCVCGTGIETTSHKYGLFADSCVEFEVVMADGSVVNCSKTENTDIFYTIPWSHGTIGFLTSVTIPLIPAKKFVKLEYFPTQSLAEATKLLKTEGKDFVEGIMFGLNKVVVMFGTMTESPEPSKINHLNAWYKPWFYKHVETYLTRIDKDPNSNANVEYIPIRDYYHRHQRSYFWELESGFQFGNNYIFRHLFGWIYPFNFQLFKIVIPKPIMTLFFERNHVLQDFMVPMNKLETVLNFSHHEVEIYPLWLCPCKFFNAPTIAHATGKKDELFIDVGIYGTTKKIKEFDAKRTTKKFEKVALENNGYQFLYADCYLTKPEFQKMFDLRLYDQVREKYRCDDAFPHVYDKISFSART